MVPHGSKRAGRGHPGPVRRTAAGPGTPGHGRPGRRPVSAPPPARPADRRADRADRGHRRHRRTGRRGRRLPRQAVQPDRAARPAAGASAAARGGAPGPGSGAAGRSGRRRGGPTLRAARCRSAAAGKGVRSTRGAGRACRRGSVAGGADGRGLGRELVRVHQDPRRDDGGPAAPTDGGCRGRRAPGPVAGNHDAAGGTGTGWTGRQIHQGEKGPTAPPHGAPRSPAPCPGGCPSPTDRRTGRPKKSTRHPRVDDTWRRFTGRSGGPADPAPGGRGPWAASRSAGGSR